MFQAKDLMTKKVRYLRPDQSASEAGEFLISNELSTAPVALDDGPKLKLLGFLSEADLLSFCANQAYFDQPNMMVSDLMRTHPYCVAEEMELFELAQIFMSSKYRNLPVLDEGGALVGIVGRRNVLSKFLELIKQEDAAILNRVQPKDLHQLMNHRFIVG